MLNCFFGENHFPDSRYLVDQLLNSDAHWECHARCPTCKKYVRKFAQKERNAICTLCNKSFSLKSPLYTDFFVIFNIENQIKDLLESNSKNYEALCRSRLQDKEIIEDFTDGLQYKNFMNELPEDRKNNFASLTMNSDGSPVFKSPKYSIWPIQAIINELAIDVRLNEVIVCGMWFNNMNIFLDPFVDKIANMSHEVIACNIDNHLQNIFIYALCCCVDSGAHPCMQGIIQYDGYFGCSWCLHPGVYVETETGGCVKYP